MKRLENQLTKHLALRVNRLYNQSTRELVGYELRDYGILVVSDPGLSESKSDDWTTILVEPARLGNVPYRTKIAHEILYALIDCGYLRDLRQRDMRKFKALMYDGGWARRIISRRLDYYKELPKHRRLIAQNKDYLEDLTRMIGVEPAFFDRLYL